MYKLSPSKAHRYLQCTKSLEYDTEFIETPVTIRGNELHTFAEMKIRNQDTEEFEKQKAFNNYEYFLIRSYVNAIFEELKEINGEYIEVENKKPVSIYGFEINFIIDTLIMGKKIASIIDLKTGNSNVDADDNEQLYFYAYAIATEFPHIEVFRLSIFQKGKMKTVSKTRTEILDFFFGKYEVFEAIKNNELTYNPSEKACKYCAYKQECQARARWIINGKK